MSNIKDTSIIGFEGNETAFKNMLTSINEQLKASGVDTPFSENYTKSTFVTIMFEGKHVGFATLSKFLEWEYVLDSIYVLPNFRNKGFGKMLLEFTVNLVKNSGSEQKVLKTKANYEEKIFLAKHQFRQYGPTRSNGLTTLTRVLV